MFASFAPDVIGHVASRFSIDRAMQTPSDLDDLPATWTDLILDVQPIFLHLTSPADDAAVP